MSLTLLILLLCVGASLWAWSSNTQQVWQLWGLSPYAMRTRSEWYRAFTSIFFHADFFHLLVNGIVFYSFGIEMEAYYRKGGYALLLGIGILGSTLFTYWKYKDNPYHISIGLSGVVSAVLFSFIVHRPQATLLVWFIPLPAWLFAILFVLYSLYEARRGHSFINHWSHLGGAAAGVLFAYFIA